MPTPPASDASPDPSSDASPDSAASGSRSGPHPGPLRTALATVTGNLQLVLSTLVLGVPGTLIGYLPPRGNWTFHLMRVWSQSILAASGCRVSVELEVPLDPKRRYVYLSNHQSLYDIPALLVTLPGQTRFAAKKELFSLPIFGWALHTSGFIPVDRARRGKAKDVLAAAARRLGQASILFFPEGTRSLDGRLHRFRRGGFLLALEHGLPIVPVGVSNTFDIRKKGSFRVTPRPIRVSYGAPIEPEELSVRDLDATIERVRRRVGELSAQELTPPRRPRTSVPNPDAEP